MVGAPGDYNTTGHLYQCSVPTNSCEPLLVPGERGERGIWVGWAESGGPGSLDTWVLRKESGMGDPRPPLLCLQVSSRLPT